MTKRLADAVHKRVESTGLKQDARMWGSGQIVVILVISGLLPKFQCWSDGSRGLYRLIRCFGEFYGLGSQRLGFHLVKTCRHNID